MWERCKTISNFCLSFVIVIIGILTILNLVVYLGGMIAYFFYNFFCEINLNSLMALSGIASAGAAIIAIIIAVQTKTQQKDLQLRQMKLDKFEVLFECYDVLLVVKSKLQKLAIEDKLRVIFLLDNSSIKRYLNVIITNGDYELKILRKSVFIVEELYVEQIELIYEKLRTIFNFLEYLFYLDENRQFEELNKKIKWINEQREVIIKNVDVLLEILAQDLDISNVHKV